LDKQTLLDKAFKTNPRATSLLPSITTYLKGTSMSISKRRNNVETPSDLVSILNPNMQKVMNELKIDTSVQNSKDLKSEKISFKDYVK
jgi:hypothetical protein